MRIGVIFPQTEIGADRGAVCAFAQAAEALGYHHLVAYDHVVGANPASRPDWQGPYNHTHMFHEPFVLFGYLAGLTEAIEFVTGIVILPQRQTVLVAKQAAAVDVFSGGRLRLGIGIGWNAVEYEALGENFHDRGRRSEEQIEVLRALWTSELVTYEGKWHKITDAGLNPMPVQRPIPVWFGGMADAVLERIGRLGDGWFPLKRAGAEVQPMIERIHDSARAAGRDLASIGIEGRILLGDRSAEEWLDEFETWRGLGASHVTVNTLNTGLATPDAHINAIRRFKEAAPGA